mgnify:FL=1|jgi:uncharacterized membrane protein YbjE (DUF340 family)
MGLIFVALLAGIAMGYLRLLPDRLFQLTGKLTTAGVMLLLFLMGGQIGSDEEILAGLGQIGVQAVLFALAAIIGSVLAVKALEAMVPLKPVEEERGRGV